MKKISEVKKIIDEFCHGHSEIPYLPDKYFPALKIFSDNPDCFVRSTVAALLVNFEIRRVKANPDTSCSGQRKYSSI